MSIREDDSFILSLHTAFQAAQQSEFSNTTHALLSILAREMGYTGTISTLAEEDGKSGDKISVRVPNQRN